jgi:hypothetical protein
MFIHHGVGCVPGLKRAVDKRRTFIATLTAEGVTHLRPRIRIDSASLRKGRRIASRWSVGSRVEPSG